MSDVERRYARSPVEFRTAPGRPGTLAGYAAAYNRMSQNLGGFVERIAPGAFTRTLSHGGDVVARFNHSDDWLLGRTSSGTLRLAADGRGLTYEVDLPDTQAGRDVAELARRGDVAHSSFAFYAVEDDWSTASDGTPLRELRQVRLVDVAPVTTPAYLDTTASLRSLAERAHTSVDDLAELAARGRLGDVVRDLRHLSGKHNQKDHGHGGGTGNALLDAVGFDPSKGTAGLFGSAGSKKAKAQVKAEAKKLKKKGAKKAKVELIPGSGLVVTDAFVGIFARADDPVVVVDLPDTDDDAAWDAWTDDVIAQLTAQADEPRTQTPTSVENEAGPRDPHPVPLNVRLRLADWINRRI